VVGQGTLLVHPAAAQRQIDADRAAELERERQRTGTGSEGKHPEPGGGVEIDGPEPPPSPKPPVAALPTQFFASKTVDNGRMSRELGDIVTEIISHLTTLPGAQVEVSLEVRAHVPGGVSQDIQRVVLENMRTLKVEGEFES
jgi:hypothetical protein